MAFKFDCFNFIYDQDQLSYGINDTFQNLIVAIRILHETSDNYNYVWDCKVFYRHFLLYCNLNYNIQYNDYYYYVK